jgi:hypothetical protein
MAAGYMHTGTMKALLEGGANPQIRDNSGKVGGWQLSRELGVSGVRRITQTQSRDNSGKVGVHVHARV